MIYKIAVSVPIFENFTTVAIKEVSTRWFYNQGTVSFGFSIFYFNMMRNCVKVTIFGSQAFFLSSLYFNLDHIVKVSLSLTPRYISIYNIMPTPLGRQSGANVSLARPLFVIFWHNVCPHTTPTPYKYFTLKLTQFPRHQYNNRL